METDEVIESGLEFEDNEWEDEYEDAVLDEENTHDPRPELKRMYQQHPECILDYVEQVIPKLQMKFVPPGGSNVENNHRTYPFLTNFEKTKIIGLRANQLSKGSIPFISVPKHITDVIDIARMELDQKRLPFIVKRPLPNGTFEYWRLNDLLII
jgi:DNA-directed RNA polymerase I, II, and III subunit RPABC2